MSTTTTLEYAWQRARNVALQTHATQVLAIVLGIGAVLTGLVFLIAAPRFNASPVFVTLIRPPFIPLAWGSAFLAGGAILVTTAVLAGHRLLWPLTLVGFLWFLLALMSVPDSLARGTGLTFALAATVGSIELVVTMMAAGRRVRELHT